MASIARFDWSKVKQILEYQDILRMSDRPHRAYAKQLVLYSASATLPKAALGCPGLNYSTRGSTEALPQSRRWPPTQRRSSQTWRFRFDDAEVSLYTERGFLLKCWNTSKRCFCHRSFLSSWHKKKKGRCALLPSCLSFHVLTHRGEAYIFAYRLSRCFRSRDALLH